MNKILLLTIGSLLPAFLLAQPVSQKLQKAFQEFETDSQVTNASISLYVINAKTGEIVFDKNSRIGLAPASTQKIITSVTALEILGMNYQYMTELAYTGNISNGILNGQLVLLGSGDPTLGSWRFRSTEPEQFFQRLRKAIREKGIQALSKQGNLIIDASRFSDETSPDGWIWQDIGNYYGANAFGINWRENQFDARFIPGSLGKEAVMDSLIPGYTGQSIKVESEVITGKAGSGDNTYFYFRNRNGSFSQYIAKGSIPAGVKYFDVSASHFDPASYLISFLAQQAKVENGKERSGIFQHMKTQYTETREPSRKGMTTIHKEFSPRLDSIIYWFNRKSINLYGEALVKTFAYEKYGFGSTDSGLVILKNFWKERGLDDGELNMHDGSGLSPLNRVTTHAQVEILKFAAGRPWYADFYEALPEFNHMKMKSGTISDTKGFCGYHRSKDGVDYVFSFLVNNYNGRASQLVNKMYKVLDELK